MLPVCFLVSAKSPSTKALASFFADVIDNWSVVTDQSSGTESSDLQVAKLSSSAFTMAHKMGMLSASISTSKTTVDNVITYNGNTWNGTTWTSSTKTTLDYYVSRTFTSTNKPYISSNVLYYIGKPGANTITLTTSSTETGTLYYEWTLDKNSTTNTVVGSAGTYKTLTIPAYSGKTFRKKIWNYSYSGSAKTWVAPHDGSYTMECWGSQGSKLSGSYNGWNTYATQYVGGKGGYTKGDISLSKNKYLYVYVGNNSLVGSTYQMSQYQWTYGYSFNGGAYLSCGFGEKCGGGATDIRVISGNWSNFESLKSRIMVAGGGGAAGDRGDGYGGGNGGYAGGLISEGCRVENTSLSVSSVNWYGFYSKGATQVTSAEWYYKEKNGGQYNGTTPAWLSNYMLGRFGIAGFCQDGEGGGGWYGGGGGEHCSGAGGSSYISGYSGCRAIKQSATVNTGGEAYHESGSVATISGTSYTFSNMTLFAGNKTFAAPDGTSETGHSGNGYARITYENP